MINVAMIILPALIAYLVYLKLNSQKRTGAYESGNAEVVNTPLAPNDPAYYPCMTYVYDPFEDEHKKLNGEVESYFE